MSIKVVGTDTGGKWAPLASFSFNPVEHPPAQWTGFPQLLRKTQLEELENHMESNKGWRKQSGLFSQIAPQTEKSWTTQQHRMFNACVSAFTPHLKSCGNWEPPCRLREDFCTKQDKPSLFHVFLVICVLWYVSVLKPVFVWCVTFTTAASTLWHTVKQCHRTRSKRAPSFNASKVP